MNLLYAFVRRKAISNNSRILCFDEEELDKMFFSCFLGGVLHLKTYLPEMGPLSNYFFTYLIWTFGRESSFFFFRKIYPKEYLPYDRYTKHLAMLKSYLNTRN